jgi:hypothetical protein
MRIFVSYTRRDGVLDRAALEAIDALLRANGLPYIDALHNRGANPQKYVVSKLHEADILVVCVTPAIHRSEWVRFEIATAHSRGIPILHAELDWQRNGRSLVLQRIRLTDAECVPACLASEADLRREVAAPSTAA